jgi:hypothetical protein
MFFSRENMPQELGKNMPNNAPPKTHEKTIAAVVNVLMGYEIAKWPRQEDRELR